MRSPPLIIDLPSDKSITHRAMIFAAIAEGESRIYRPLLGRDCLATLACVKAMGVDHTMGPDFVQLVSPGIGSWRSPEEPLAFENSGTTARMFIGLLAGVPGLFAVGSGDESLVRRPMGRVIRPLSAMGAKISARQGDELLPIAITGQALRGCIHELPTASAQVKSALLLAASQADGRTSIIMPPGSRDHTEKLMLRQNIPLNISVDQEAERIDVDGPISLDAQDYRIPADPSALAFVALYAALHPGLQIVSHNVLANPRRTHYLRLLREMGMGVETMSEDGEHSGTLGGAFTEETQTVHLQGMGELVAVDIGPLLAPQLIDEFPALACIAMIGRGRSCWRGLGELRFKESDRLQKICELGAAIGAKVSVEDDNLYIEGTERRRIAPFTFDSGGDHRLAMCAAVLATTCTQPCTVIGEESTSVSFPHFRGVLAQLKAADV